MLNIAEVIKVTFTIIEGSTRLACLLSGTKLEQSQTV